MKIKPRHLSWLLPLVISFCGCRHTIDYTDDPSVSKICEIHNVAMETKKLKNSTGYLGYMPEFEHAIRTNFPHYDGVRYDHVTSSLYGTKNIVDYVCTKCTAAYQEWLEKNKN